MITTISRYSNTRWMTESAPVMASLKPSKGEYPMRDGVYDWVDAFTTGMVSSKIVSDERHDSGSLFLNQKKLLMAGLCLRCEQKKERVNDYEICKDCREEMLESKH